MRAALFLMSRLIDFAPSPAATLAAPVARGLCPVAAERRPFHLRGHSMTIETWTPERVEQLCSCLVTGLTCSQIAAEIGVSRNAVIGKIHRLGLSPGRPPGGAARSCPPRARHPRAPDQRQRLRLMWSDGAPAADPETSLCPRRQRPALLAFRPRSRQMPLAARRPSQRAISHSAATPPPTAFPTAPAMPVWPIAHRRGAALSQRGGVSAAQAAWTTRSITPAAGHCRSAAPGR